MSKAADNRRRFFRIVDEVGVSYRVLTQAECEAHEDDAEGVSHHVDTMSVMHGFNSELNEFLDKLESTSPDVAAAVAVLNKKLDSFLMMLELDNLISQRACHSVQEASISASGIAFPVEQSVTVGSVLVLDLLLRPSSKHVNAMGKVISCDSLANNSNDFGYYMRVEFVDMKEKDRETLIQHIVQRQGVLLRALRHQMDEGEM